MHSPKWTSTRYARTSSAKRRGKTTFAKWHFKPRSSPLHMCVTVLSLWQRSHSTLRCIQPTDGANPTTPLPMHRERTKHDRQATRSTSSDREREKGYGLDVSRSQGVCELKPVVPQRRYIRMRPSYLIRQRCYVSISVWICASGYAPPMNVSRRRATDKGKIGPRGKPYFSVAFQQASCIDSSLRLWKEPTKEDSDLRWIRQDSSPSPPLHLH